MRRHKTDTYLVEESQTANLVPTHRTLFEIQVNSRGEKLPKTPSVSGLTLENNVKVTKMGSLKINIVQLP